MREREINERRAEGERNERQAEILNRDNERREEESPPNQNVQINANEIPIPIGNVQQPIIADAPPEPEQGVRYRIHHAVFHVAHDVNIN